VRRESSQSPLLKLEEAAPAGESPAPA
jgi:hypothetical protein